MPKGKKAAKRKTAARKAPARPRKAPRAKGKAATGRRKDRSFPAATLHPLSEYRHMNSWW